MKCFHEGKTGRGRWPRQLPGFPLLRLSPPRISYYQISDRRPIKEYTSNSSLKDCSHTRFIPQHPPSHPQFTVEDSGDSEQDPTGTRKTWILLSFLPSSSCQLPGHEATHIHATREIPLLSLTSHVCLSTWSSPVGHLALREEISRSFENPKMGRCHRP